MKYILSVSVLLVGCEIRQAMFDDGRVKPFEKSDFFGDGRTARPLVAGTIARGHLKADNHLHQGKVGGRYVTSFPFDIDRERIERGKERYNIYCSVCHGHVGTGNGMIVQRGFPKPPTLHQKRLRLAPEGYFFEVISNGIGDMAGYRSQVEVEDRWAIIAYIRALQFSQNVDAAMVPDLEARMSQESQ